MQYLIKLFMLATITFIVGCGDPLTAQIEKQLPVTEQKIADLKKALSNGEVRNANLILDYANKLHQSKPELTTLIDEFAKDATSNGPLFNGLLSRLDTVKNQPQLFDNKQAIFDELVNLYQAAEVNLYSDALSDPLNVLADMSDGVLPRVNSLSRNESIAANKAQDFGVGSQLVGNPNYGSWQTGSNGMSFWAWYGMYSMMGDVFGSRRIYYNDWGRGRNYSYYHDYGRNRYTSPSQYKTQSDIETRTKKNFGSKGYTSAYSKNKTGGSSLSRQSQQAQKSSDRFRSSNNNKSSYAKNASFRNSKTTTSRGVKRGK